jgi:RNA polymerase primary sigma factor
MKSMTEFVANQQIPFEPLLQEVVDPSDIDFNGHALIGDIALVDLADEVFPEDQEDSRYQHIRVSEDLISDYLKRITKVPLLNAVEEVELSKAIEAGLYAEHALYTDDTVGPSLRTELSQIREIGDDAYDTMIMSNLRLVVSIAKRYISRNGAGLEFSELIQEGNFGLYRAVEKFDYKRGLKFSTYATWWIRQSITRAMSDQARTIRLPVHIGEAVNRIRRTTENLQKAGVKATDEAIGMELDLSPQKVREIRLVGRNPLSLQWEMDNSNDRRPGTETTFADLIEDTNTPSPQEIVEQNDMQTTVLSGIHRSLKERERLIIMYRYGFDGQPPATLDQIGKMFGVTRERIRQIETRAMDKLRHDEKLQQLADSYALKKT